MASVPAGLRNLGERSFEIVLMGLITWRLLKSLAGGVGKKSFS